CFVDFVAVRLERRRGVRASSGGTVLQLIAPGDLGLFEGQPFQEQRVRLGQAVGERYDHERTIPEVLRLVVLGDAPAHSAALTDVRLLRLAALAAADEKVE